MAITKWMESLIGLFILTALLSVALLAFKVSTFSSLSEKKSYNVTAEFDNIGSLKPRSAVTIAGVKIGQVSEVRLDPVTYKAVVSLRLNDENHVPSDSAASIVTAGLLGSNYIAITPGFEEAFLRNGDRIEETHPALILEEMIGQLLFSMKKEDNKDQPAN